MDSFFFFTPQPLWPKRYCRHLSPSVCRDLLSEDNWSLFFWARITKFAPNVYLGFLHNPVENDLIDLVLHGNLGSKRSKSAHNGLVRTITRHVFELGSPNLHQLCILGPSRTLLKMVSIDLDLQGHLGLKLSKSAKNGLVRTYDNSSYIWARTTKFAPNVYLGTLQKPIENGVDWPCPSRSFGVKTVEIGQQRACPHNNSSRFLVRIT